MGSIDECHELFWTAVAFLCGVNADPVIPPTETTGEGRHGHHFQHLDPQVFQDREFFDGCGESTLRGEGSHVEFVKHFP